MIAAALDIGIPPFIEHNRTAEHCKHEVQLLGPPVIAGLAVCASTSKKMPLCMSMKCPGKFRVANMVSLIQASERIVIALLRLRNLYKNIFRKLLLYDLHKAIIVLPEHCKTSGHRRPTE